MKTFKMKGQSCGIALYHRLQWRLIEVCDEDLPPRPAGAHSTTHVNFEPPIVFSIFSSVEQNQDIPRSFFSAHNPRDRIS